eukprot:1688210-Pyramimonas_sp.AAC.1
MDAVYVCYMCPASGCAFLGVSVPFMRMSLPSVRDGMGSCAALWLLHPSAEIRFVCGAMHGHPFA